MKLQRLRISAVSFCSSRAGVITFSHRQHHDEAVFRGARWVARNVHPQCVVGVIESSDLDVGSGPKIGLRGEYAQAQGSSRLQLLYGDTN